MKIKVFEPNRYGKIEFTCAELEKLLNEVYSDGYRNGESDARSRAWTWTSPYLTNTPYYTISTCSTDADKSIDNLTCKDVNTNNTTVSDVDNSIITHASAPSTYSINLNSGDVHSLFKAANEIITNASRGVRPSTDTLNVFDALAKELNS